jgi:1-acyl-sn-glycerol-3-phosphate acyltransferase
MNHRIHPCAGMLAVSARLISGAQPRWFNCEPLLRQRVYFANHTSHLDLLVLWATLPMEIRAMTRPVAAGDYWSNGIARRYVAGRIFRAVMIERPETPVASHGIMEPVLKALNAGESLILFPEGTRGTGEEVAPFKSGLYHMCRMWPNLEAVPVYLENLNRILPKGEFLPVPLLSQVTFGPAIQVGPNESKDEFLARARSAICELRNL